MNTTLFLRKESTLWVDSQHGRLGRCCRRYCTQLFWIQDLDFILTSPKRRLPVHLPVKSGPTLARLREQAGPSCHAPAGPPLQLPSRPGNLTTPPQHFKSHETASVLRIRDPMPFWPLEPGSGMGKKSGSGYRTYNPDHISKSFQTISWVKGTQEWEFFWLRFWILYYFIVSYVKILRFCKKNLLIGPVLEEVRFFCVVLGLRGMKKMFELGQKNIFLFFYLWTLYTS
jgi:hypothetical protein